MEKWEKIVKGISMDLVWKDRFFDFTDFTSQPVKEILQYQYYGL